MTRLSDTSPEADRVLTEVHRRMSAGQKWLRLGQAYRDARLLHAAGVRLRQPSATPRDILRDWVAVQIGEPSVPLREPVMDPSLLNLRDLRAVLAVFDGLNLAHALGGSMASSVHGIVRHTQDADVTVEPFPGRETQVTAAFGPDHYLSLAAVQDAVRNRSSFNLINTATGFKVDVFVCKDNPFEQSAFRRRLTLDLPDAPGQPLSLYTPEDIVLFKLHWYRLGHEVSDRHWGDVLGVLKVQAGNLDEAYLDQWAAALGVDDLLARARTEAAS